MDRQVADVYYTALLQHIGCVGFAHETAAAYGDEMAVNAALRAWGRGRNRRRRDLSAGGSRQRHCEVGGETARRLGLGEGVQRGLRDVVEVWDGSAGARGLHGERDLARGAHQRPWPRSHRSSNEARRIEAAEAAVRGLAGSELDPEVAAAFLERSAEILGEVGQADPRDVVLAIEPAPVRVVEAGRLTDVAGAIGDVADLKSAHTLGHSTGVTALALAAGERLGLDTERLALLEIAALLHDVGRVGISNAIWERPGPLTRAEWEQVRLHPTTRSASWPAPRPLSLPRPSPGCITSASTGRDITAAPDRARFRSKPASWRRRTPSTR